MVDPAVDLTDKQLGPYRIVAILGEGGMGVVYKAYEARLTRYVALKVLSRRDADDPDDSVFVSRFWQEARAAATLEHPHILPIYTFGEHEGHHYIAMKLVRQGSLADLLHGEPLLMNQMAHIINQIGGALDYAHSRNVVHLDVKPDNILISRLSGCLLTDFGIARLLEATAQDTETEVTFGTPIYMSPEQMRGDRNLDSRSDIYSLGVVLYEMATGRPPFKGTTAEIQKQHLNSAPPPPRALNPALPKLVAKVILKALAKEPDARFATAGGLARALQAAIPDGLVPSGPGAAAILGAASSGVEEDAALESDEPIVDDEELTAILEASSARPSIEERQRAQTEPIPIPAPLPLSQRLKQVPTGVWVAALVLAAVVLVGLMGLGGFDGRPLSSAGTPTVIAGVVPDDAETPTATSTVPFIHTSAPKPTATDTRMPTPTRTVTATPEPTPTETPAPTQPPTPTDTATPEPTATDTPQAARPRPADLTGRLAVPLMYGNEPKVYIVTTDGELESVVGGARQPAYSGDGSRLMVDGVYGVWDKLRILDPIGGGPYEIGDPALAGHSYPSWSPDGSMVIYEDSTVDPRGSRLFTRDLDTNGPDSGAGTQLKAGVGRGELIGRNPLWTTEDRYVFRGCNTWERGKESDCGIWLMQGNGGEPEQLTADPNHIPTDVYGDIVVFVSPEEGDWNVYTLNLVTGATRRITDDEASDGLAAISPDGRSVAFLSDRGGNQAVWYVPITGGSAKKFFDVPADWGQLAAAGWNEEKLSWGSE